MLIRGYYRFLSLVILSACTKIKKRIPLNAKKKNQIPWFVCIYRRIASTTAQFTAYQTLLLQEKVVFFAHNLEPAVPIINNTIMKKRQGVSSRRDTKGRTLIKI